MNALKYGIYSDPFMMLSANDIVEFIVLRDHPFEIISLSNKESQGKTAHKFSLYFQSKTILK